MKLTHPDEIEDEDKKPNHPITSENVEQAHRMSDADISLEELHDYLELVQEALEHRLQQKPGLLDPLNFIEEVPHRVHSNHTGEQNYSHLLYIEDGKFGFGNEKSRRRAVAAHETSEELPDDASHEEFEDRFIEKIDEVSLDDYTEDEIYDLYSEKLQIWDEVADIFSLDQNSGTLRAIKLAHELQFHDGPLNHTEYGTTGFVTGLPKMFMSGMRTEQRYFSALAGTGLTPAQLVDAYGQRTSYHMDKKWAAKRGVSKSAVSQNRENARNHLTEKYNRDTLPSGLP